MEKTKFDEMMDRLPSNIKETDVLRCTSKKVLAALLELLIHSEARTSRVIYCQNSRLRKIAGVGSKELRPAIDQLIDYNLITRKVGTRNNGTGKGGTGEASEYTINLKKLKEPLTEKSFDDLFGDFIEEQEPSEKPISTTIITATSSSIITSTLTSSQEQGQVQQQVKQEEPARPSSYKELMGYFIRRMEVECKNKNLDELNKIQESLKDELDEFNKITDYQNIYKYLIVPSMDKKREKLLVEELEKGSANSRIAVLTESEASAPSEDLSQASPVKNIYTSTEAEVTPVKEQSTPTENEQWQQWIDLVRPFKDKIASAETPEQMNGIKDRALQAMSDYLNIHTYTSSKVFETVKKSVVMAYDFKLNKLTSKSITAPISNLFT